MTALESRDGVALSDRAEFEAWATDFFKGASPSTQFAATEIARAGWEARAALRTPATTGEGEVATTLMFLEEAISIGRREGMAGQHLSAMCDARDTIKAQAALPPNSGWQPIETAPRDGTWVLVHAGDTHVACLSDYTSKDQWWTQGASLLSDPMPTHWQPLPPPPSRDAE